jgi:hypothetical protein
MSIPADRQGRLDCTLRLLQDLEREDLEREGGRIRLNGVTLEILAQLTPNGAQQLSELQGEVISCLLLLSRN